MCCNFVCGFRNFPITSLSFIALHVEHTHPYPEDLLKRFIEEELLKMAIVRVIAAAKKKQPAPETVPLYSFTVVKFTTGDCSCEQFHYCAGSTRFYK